MLPKEPLVPAQVEPPALPVTPAEKGRGLPLASRPGRPPYLATVSPGETERGPVSYGLSPGNVRHLSSAPVHTAPKHLEGQRLD